MDSSVVTVSTTGVVTAVAVGATQVAASSGGQSAVVPVAVVPIQVATVAVLPSEASVIVRGTVALQAVTYDAAGNTLPGRAVVWASSASQIASVDASGAVTGVTAGTATITATSEGKTASATVTVTLVPVAAVTVTPGSATIVAGHSASLSAVATDANGNVLSGRVISWSSANQSIATVNSLGLVTAIGAGTTTISATSEGKSGAAQVIVSPAAPAPVASVSVTPPAADIQTGATTALTATLHDSAGATLTGRTVTWTSGTQSVATVSSSGVVTAVSSGVATITAMSEGKTATATVTVHSPPATVAVRTVTVNPTSLSLRHGQIRTLTAQALDANGHEVHGVTIVWTSSNDDAVSVTPTSDTKASVTASGSGLFALVIITATCQGVSGTSLITFLN
jgi:uncharacterized protein YjdB